MNKRLIIFMFCLLLINDQLIARRPFFPNVKDSLQVATLLDSASRLIKSGSQNYGRLLDKALIISTKMKSAFLQSYCFSVFADGERKDRTSLLFLYDSLAVYYAQKSKNDSLLVTNLVKITLDYSSIGKTGKAKPFIGEAITLAEKKADPFLLCLSYYGKGCYLIKSIKFLAAKEAFKKALPYAEGLKDELRVALIKRQLYHAIISFEKTDINHQIVLDALKYFEKTDAYERANCQYIIGLSYFQRNDIAKAIQNYREAAEIYKKEGHSFPEADSYFQLAFIYARKKEFGKALQWTALGEKISFSRKYVMGILKCHLSYALIYGIMEDIPKSDLYFNRADSLNKKDSNKVNTAAILGYKVERERLRGTVGKKENAELLKKTGLLYLEMLSPEVIESFATDSQRRGIISEVEAADMRNFARTGKTSTAIWNNKKDNEGLSGPMPSNAAFDSAYVTELTKSLREIEEKYHLEKTKASLDVAVLENRIKDEELRSAALQANLNINRRNWIIAISAAVILFIGFILYRVNNEKKREKQEKIRAIEDKKTIDLLRKEADHRIGNTLATISDLIDNVKTKASDKDSFDFLEERVEPLMILYRTLGKTEKGDIDMQDYFSTICNNLRDAYSFSRSIDVFVDAPVIMDGKKAGNAGLIVNELVTNSFKHAFDRQSSGFIRVVCKQDERGRYNLKVSDTGKGINSDSADEDNLGLLHVRALAQELSATINNENKNGACFEFYFL